MNILPWDGEISWDGSWSDYDTGGTVVDDSQRIVLDDPSSSTKGEPSTEEQRREAMRRKTGGTGTVNLYVTVQRATDAEAIRLAKKVKMLLDSDSELVSAGDGKF
jgi:predicted RND superfamily exporter protein